MNMFFAAALAARQSRERYVDSITSQLEADEERKKCEQAIRDQEANEIYRLNAKRKTLEFRAMMKRSMSPQEYIQYKKQIGIEEEE